jgi:hypothetical protein
VWLDDETCGCAGCAAEAQRQALAEALEKEKASATAD